MDALVNFRKDQGLSRREMAEILGVSLSFYEKVERGERFMSGNLARKLKDKFPLVDVNIFFTSEEHLK